MNSRKFLFAFVLLVAGTVTSIYPYSHAGAAVGDVAPRSAPKVLSVSGRITGIAVNPSPATVGSPIVVTIYGSGICPGVNLFIGIPVAQGMVTGTNAPTSVASASLDADFRSSGSVQSQLIVRFPPGQPYVVKAASRQCEGLAEAKLEVRPAAAVQARGSAPTGAAPAQTSQAVQVPGSAVTKAEQNITKNSGLAARLENKAEKANAPSRSGIAGAGAIRAPNALQPQPLQTKPLTGGPSGNPTLGGIDKILFSPSPAIAGNQVKFTVQGWGKCTSVGISFGDTQEVYSLSDVDFSKPFELTYIYRSVTQPGQPYVMRVAGRSVQPSPCTTQAIAYVDVKPPPVGMKIPGSSIAKAQQSLGGNIRDVPGALKESLVEARRAQRQGALPKSKSPPPPPEVTSVWTAGIRPGEVVNVVGKNFGRQPGRVRLIRYNDPEGDRYLDITEWKNDLVQVRVPDNYPARDTDNRALQVVDARDFGSNLWDVHSRVVIEEEVRMFPPGIFMVESCAGPLYECKRFGWLSDTFGALHQTGSFTARSGTDVYSLKNPLGNGWRLHSCRYLDPPTGVIGDIEGCERGRRQDIKLSVRWFHEAGLLVKVEYRVVVMVVGPKGTVPW